MKNGKELNVRGEAKNATDQKYLFDGCSNFFQKASKVKDIDTAVFLSFEQMDTNKGRKKRQREEIKAVKKSCTTKSFLIVDNIKSTPTTLNLSFLTAPD